MSGQEFQSKNFLARWSRRKHQAKAGDAAPEPDKLVDAKDLTPPGDISEEIARSEADLSNLPPINAIDATTDITAFLRKGIPQELSREALRRAWTADPAIRDFVGLAENAWDFNDPNAMPGFGPLDYSAEQVEALVQRIVGGVAQAAERVADAAAGAESEPTGVATEPAQAPPPADGAEPAEPSAERASIEHAPFSAASQNEPPTASEATFTRRRTSGGALPQ